VITASCEVSVVICTFNRSAQLGRALDALLAQTGGVDYEVVLVDNNSTDATRAVVAERLSRSHRLRYFFEARQGIPYARNTGLRATRAPIVAYTDDDVMVGPEWVATVKRLFDENPDIDMLGGRVRPIWPADVPSWVTPQQLGPFALGERGDAPIVVSADNAAPCLVGANFAFRRSVFERVGAFDPAYPRSQDREIQLRLWEAGGRGLYAPELVISVEIPADRLTRKYFRHWYRTYGVYHSRMRLLDRIDAQGRLIEPRGRTIAGVPAFLYREFLTSALRLASATLRRDRSSAFYWENRCRYLYHYIRERARTRAPRHRPAPGDITTAGLPRPRTTA
jgi:glycosyltransferase involved in cell wall biosynthesis